MKDMPTHAGQARDAAAAPAPRALAYGDPDGHGHYGILEETAEGLRCHECEWVGAHLGLHVAKTHNLPAADYRVEHGLRRSKGLVAEATRATIQANATRRYSDNGPLARSRDLSKANAARLAAGRPASVEEAAQRDMRMSSMARDPHARRVVTCEWCGVQFCPIITNISKRRFCCRSCANTHNRSGRT